MAGAHRMSPSNSCSICRRMGYPWSEVTLIASYAFVLSASEYGPLTPASRSAVRASMTTSGYSCGSAGRASAALLVAARMPWIPAAG